MRRLTVAAAVLCVACGGAGVEGRYTGQGETFFDSLTFRSDGKVEIVFVGGKNEGAYQVDGSRVILTAPNGDQSALAIDSNGCLSHQLLTRRGDDLEGTMNGETVRFVKR